MSKRIVGIVGCVFCTALVVTSAPACAEISYSIFVDGSQYLEAADSSPGPSLTDALDVDLADAAVALGYGWERLRFNAEHRAPSPDYPVGQASVNLGWEDYVTISSPGLGGTAGTVHFDLVIEGSGYAEEPPGWGVYGATLASVVVNVQGAAGIDQLQYTWHSKLGFYGDAFGKQSFQIPITFGVPFLLAVGMYGGNVTTTIGPASGTGSAGAEFWHTLTWDGITEVTDSGGGPVASYSLSSDAGIDWRVAQEGPLGVHGAERSTWGGVKALYR